jgi:hypothetical protein
MTDRYIDYLPLHEITPATRNPKGHDTEGIARSIGHFGLAEVPLLDERTGRLVAGHGRHTDLVTRYAEGKGAPEGVRVTEDGTWLVPVIRGWRSRSDEDAEAYLVASNQLTANGGWDERGLTEVLEELAAVNLLELTGYDQTGLDNLLALVDDSNWDDAQPLSSGTGDLGEPDDSKFWPKLDLGRVPPDVFDAWNTLLNKHEGANDVAKLTALLRATGDLL